jgi:hypothetical protein
VPGLQRLRDRHGRGPVLLALPARDVAIVPPLPATPSPFRLRFAVQSPSDGVRRLTTTPEATIGGAMAESQTKTTTDHDEIRRWVEEHGGTPASVRGTEKGDPAGVLRLDFPGGAGEDELEPISWDDWFDKFDSRGLALLYQEQKASGEDSTFFKLVNR